jgi:hypothetical protein
MTLLGGVLASPDLAPTTSPPCRGGARSGEEAEQFAWAKSGRDGARWSELIVVGLSEGLHGNEQASVPRARLFAQELVGEQQVIAWRTYS